MGSVFLIAEQKEGHLKRVTLEILGELLRQGAYLSPAIETAYRRASTGGGRSERSVASNHIGARSTRVD